MASELSVDVTSKRYYDHYFAVTFIDSYTNEERFAMLSSEKDFNTKFGLARIDLINRINQQMKFFLTDKTVKAYQKVSIRK